LPDDIANDITDIPHDLELNQEDFSDVLPRLPDDLQDFDFFEGMVNILIKKTGWKKGNKFLEVFLLF
jgi:INO80 complex subunit D